MPDLKPSREELLRQLEALRGHLEEVEETLRAIRTGEVDALVVSTPVGEHVFTLEGAEHPYRVMVETMSEGAVTIAHDGTILYCNHRFGEMVKSKLESVIGASITRFIGSGDGQKLAALMAESWEGGGQVTLSLSASDGTSVPVCIAARHLDYAGIDGIITVITDLTEIVAAEEKLREMAIRDALTGLFNRRYLDETLERELAKAQREGRPLSLVVMDIDRFKEVNDAFGHKAGDVMLQRLGELLRAQTRAGDVACRYGGEEFVMVLPDMPPETAYERAEEWRVLVEGLRVPYGRAKLHVEMSMGVAAYPVDGRTADELLMAADNALYAAKLAGRNRVAAARQTGRPER